MIGNMFAALLLAAASPGDSVPANTWRVEASEASCLVTGWLRRRSSVSMIFSRARRLHGPAADPTSPQIWVDGRRLPSSGASSAIVAFDAPTWREESEVDRDALARLLATATRLQMRRPDGRVIATVPLSSAHRIAAQLRRCIAGPPA